MVWWKQLFNWRELFKFKGDKILWGIIILLMVVSVLLIYSSTGRLAYSKQDGNTLFYVIKQLTFLLASFGVLFVAQIFPWKKLYDWAPVLLGIAGVLLLIAAFGGSNINGAGRWIKIPILGITFQPSEFAKIAVVIYVSRLFADFQEERWCSNEILLSLWAPASIIFLIFLDNFSTSVLISVVCLGLCIFGRMRWGLLGKIVGSLLAVLAFIMVLGFTIPESRNWGRIGTIVGRLTEFVDVTDSGNDDKKDYNMQSDHARMAIAQGGLTGRGPGNSIHRNILPHAYSDFIYAILIEEYSFFGGLFVLVLYLVILYRSLRIAKSALKAQYLNARGRPDIFPVLLVLGLGLLVTLQAMFHMGVNTTALPVTGQTLPLISLGGTSLLFTSAALGIMLNVAYSSSPEYLEKEENEINLYKDREQDECDYEELPEMEEVQETRYSARRVRREVRDEDIDVIGEDGVLEREFEQEGRKVLRELRRR